MNFREQIEKVIHYFSEQDSYLDEIIAAKEDFFERTGKITEEDPHYENRMVIFTEWFTLDRPLPRVGLTPVRLYYEIFGDNCDQNTVETVMSLDASIHTLFQYKGQKKEWITVVDLFDNRSYKVYERRDYAGLEEGALFEGRIAMKDGHYMFSDTHCLHPKQAVPRIVEQIQRSHYESRSDFIAFAFHLAALRLRFDRYRKVEVHRVYTFEVPDAA